jgi:hypothetical protein
MSQPRWWAAAREGGLGRRRVSTRTVSRASPAGSGPLRGHDDPLSRPFCPCDSRQAGFLYLPARWRYTTPRRGTRSPLRLRVGGLPHLVGARRHSFHTTHGGGKNTEHLGYKFICGCATISLPLLKGNDMALAILALHYCSVHKLLFCPSLQAWLSFSPVQLEHTFGEAMRLTESACPRCTTITKEALHKQFPKLSLSSVPLKASGF